MKTFATITATIVVLASGLFAAVGAAPQFKGAATPAATALDEEKVTERDATNSGFPLSPREKRANPSVWGCTEAMGPDGMIMCERDLALREDEHADEHADEEEEEEEEEEDEYEDEAGEGEGEGVDEGSSHGVEEEGNI